MSTEQTNTRLITKQVPPNMRDRYTERVKKATFGESKSSGNEMITLECEIINPQTLKDGDKEYDLTSLERKYYLSLSNKVSEKTGGSPREKTNKVLELLGFEPVEKGTKPSEEMMKKLNDRFCFDAIINSSEKVLQRKNEKGEYVPITDSRGQPIKRGFELTTNPDDILYRVDEPENAPKF